MNKIPRSFEKETGYVEFPVFLKLSKLLRKRDYEISKSRIKNLKKKDTYDFRNPLVIEIFKTSTKNFLYMDACYYCANLSTNTKFNFKNKVNINKFNHIYFWNDFSF